MSSQLSPKQQAFLDGLTVERSALQYRATLHMRSNDFAEMTRIFAVLAKIDAKIQSMVGCACSETGGGAECGGMEYDEKSDSLAGTMCSCECHDRIMARLPESLKESVRDRTFSFPCVALLALFDDEWDA